MTKTPIIAPSILAANFAHLGDDIQKVNNADWIHVDIMDGHFVPNLSFGAGITADVHKVTDQPLDVHLMIDNPEKWVDDDHVALADHIRSKGIRAGFSLRPGTPIEPYLKDLDHFDLVLVMSVEPGFGGQSFMPDQLDKVRYLRAEIDSHNLSTLIEIDGGIGEKTITDAAIAGCDAFVAGSAVFGADDPHAAVESLRRLATV